VKAEAIILTVALCFVAAELCFAADVHLGTWKLHAANSEFSSGSPKNDTVIYAAVGDKVKVTVDGTDKDGKPTHSEWTGTGTASASDGLTIQGGKTRGGCTDDLKTLLTAEWQESAGVKDMLLSIGYGLPQSAGQRNSQF
jgi:hypothetical protein